MASTTLGSTYVLSAEGAEQLLGLLNDDVPADPPGFVARRIEDPSDRAARLASLQERLHRASARPTR